MLVKEEEVLIASKNTRRSSSQYLYENGSNGAVEFVSGDGIEKLLQLLRIILADLTQNRYRDRIISTQRYIGF